MHGSTTTLVSRLNTLLLPLTFALVLSLAGAQRVTVLTHNSFSLPTEVVEEFTVETGIEVVFLAAGDAGEVVNRAILTKANPVADLLYGIDDGLLERARFEELFEPYESPALTGVPAEFRISEDHLVTPVDVGWVLPNVDVGWFAESGLALPTTLEELADPQYEGLLVVENPATSSPGLAFLFATVSRFGDPLAGVGPSASGFAGDWLDFWAALRENGLEVADGWTEAYYSLFTIYGGERPVVVSYLTSPAAELIFADEPLETPPTANLACAGCAYRQIEAIGILRGAKEPAAAAQFVDFMLSKGVQEAIPLAMFVHPVRADAVLPPEFAAFAGLPAGAAAETLPSEVVQEHQRRWLSAWTAVVLQGRDPASVRDR